MQDSVRMRCRCTSCSPQAAARRACQGEVTNPGQSRWWHCPSAPKHCACPTGRRCPPAPKTRLRDPAGDGGRALGGLNEAAPRGAAQSSALDHPSFCKIDAVPIYHLLHSHSAHSICLFLFFRCAFCTIQEMQHWGK